MNATPRRRVSTTRIEDCPPRRLVVRRTTTLTSVLEPVCPDCSKTFVKRVNCEGIGERLSSFFYLYPFRCQLCGHRFKYRQWGVRYAKVKNDRREYDRVGTSFPVSITADNIEAEGRVTDISIAGCTVSTDADLERGMVLSLGLQISSKLVPVIVDAAVVRNVRQNSVGIEFLRFQENDREMLQLFIRGLLLDQRRSATIALQPDL
jgi:hypothetical protein